MTPPTHTLGAFLQEKFTQECVERSVTPPPPDELASICDSVAHSLHHAAVGRHEALKQLANTYAFGSDEDAWP
jgi:hypothetical protein